MSKNRALYGAACKELGTWTEDMRHGPFADRYNGRSRATDRAESGIRRQRRERAAQKLLAAAHGEPMGMTVAPKPAACQCFDCWAYRATMEWWFEDDDCDGMPYSAETVTFDADGAHVNNCDLPRCPECAEILGCKPWWEEAR